MNQNENINEQQAANIPPVVKPTKKPLSVSIPTLILLLVLTALITFQTTYVVLNVKHTLEITKTKAQMGEFGVLLEAYEIFGENCIYDLDGKTLSELMLSAFRAQDQYSSYYTAEEFAEMLSSSQGEAKGIGIYISGTGTTMVVNYVMENSPAASAGVKAGDEVLAIDGHLISEIGYTAATDLVLGKEGTNVVLTILRNGEKKDITVTRGKYTPQTVLYSEIEHDGEKIGYVKLIQFDTLTVEQFKGAVEALRASGCEKLVFDLRSNPGGELDSVVEILDYLLPEGPITHILDADKNVVEVYKSDAKCVDMPMAVITNGSTASAAELFTSALRDYEMAEIVGTKTYGKGCGQNFYRLSNGGWITITSFFYNPPFGENYDGEGIHPNIEVELPDEYKNSNLFLLPKEADTQLQAALTALTK